jgi:hypothetical protein
VGGVGGEIRHLADTRAVNNRDETCDISIST